MVLITINGVTDPNSDPILITVNGVTQDEKTNGLGDGDTAKDAKYPSSATNPGPLQVRAERSGLDDGRVYTIAFTAYDGKGGSCTGTVAVGVPHDTDHPVAVKSPSSYDSTQ